jgi:hypothetical protein
VISTGEAGVVIGVYEKRGSWVKPGTVPRDLSGGDQSLGPPDCLSANDNASHTSSARPSSFGF